MLQRDEFEDYPHDEVLAPVEFSDDDFSYGRNEGSALEQQSVTKTRSHGHHTHKPPIKKHTVHKPVVKPKHKAPEPPIYDDFGDDSADGSALQDGDAVDARDSGFSTLRHSHKAAHKHNVHTKKVKPSFLEAKPAPRHLKNNGFP